jgi:hypothetical protein
VLCVVSHACLSQVLTNPAYMEDHLAVLNADLAAGEVPLPQLPKHKQVRRVRLCLDCLRAGQGEGGESLCAGLSNRSRQLAHVQAGGWLRSIVG